MLPNDDKEHDRLTIQHHIFRLSVDGPLYLAPIPSDVQNVLDLGSGTGIVSATTIFLMDYHRN